jgi:hypothetical protein
LVLNSALWADVFITFGLIDWAIKMNIWYLLIKEVLLAVVLLAPLSKYTDTSIGTTSLMLSGY